MGLPLEQELTYFFLLACLVNNTRDSFVINDLDLGLQACTTMFGSFKWTQEIELSSHGSWKTLLSELPPNTLHLTALRTLIYPSFEMVFQRPLPCFYLCH